MFDGMNSKLMQLLMARSGGSQQPVAPSMGQPNADSTGMPLIKPEIMSQHVGAMGGGIPRMPQGIPGGAMSGILGRFFQPNSPSIPRVPGMASRTGGLGMPMPRLGPKQPSPAPTGTGAPLGARPDPQGY